ncbi:MAG: M1 family metallopeptidase [Flammeovirgaceae bacterium]
MKNYYKNLFIFSLSLLFFLGCNFTESSKKEENLRENNPIMTLTKDKHSFARPDEAQMTHLELDLEVDFTEKILKGIAHISIKNNHSKKLLIDTQDLIIEKVFSEGKELPFQLHEKIEFLGSALEIDIDENTDKVSIQYKTSPQSQALQWLEPSQTSSGKNPFLFTQSQPHLARSWVPCQDSPGIRFTYNAKVKVPQKFLALMSAENPTSKKDDGLYYFQMKYPIPAYLMALAVGDIDFKAVGNRTGVYAEPNMLAKVAKEFEDIEKMLIAAEKLFGTYRWGRYDLIVLPLSFPFGGMENPRLTFVTPTIIAGDKSLVSLVAHELAHSWSGNLVTNSTWDDFWLNEGFTVYLEIRIMEEIYGEAIANMLALISYKDLQDELKKLDFGDDTKLKLNLAGRNPDDGMTRIAYDKGFFFLKLIEEKVGREKFDAFLRKYFEENAFKSMDTERFLSYLRNNLLDNFQGIEGQLEIEKWVYGKGLPDNCPKIQSDKFEKAFQQAKAFENGTSAEQLQTKDWSYQQWVHFLSSLKSPLSLNQMSNLDKTFKLTQSGNNEILFEWLMHAIKAEYQPAYPKLEQFLESVGRRKFVVPLYEELSQRPNTIKMAKSFYEKYRKNYHFITTSRVDKILAQ